MYVAMVDARLLDEHVAGLKLANGPRSIRGEEACRVSTAIDLGPGDVVSDSHAGVVMDLPAGAKVDSLLRRLKSKRVVRADADGGTKHLPWVMPWVKDGAQRLTLAMGVALGLRTLASGTKKQTNVVVAYVRHGDISKGEWRRILAVASRLELPIFFVVLSDGKRGKKRDFGDLGRRAGACGVPGMVVDANDAVALYRVAQETLGRLRGGGGPVLVECVGFPLDNHAASEQVDPVDQMKGFLRGRKIATDTWLEQAGAPLKRGMAAVKS